MILAMILAGVTIQDLTPQLPASIQPIDPVLGARADLNFPLVIQKHPGPLISAEIRYVFRANSIWLVENQTNAPVQASINDRFYPWVTWRESNAFIPNEYTRIGSATGFHRFWGFDLLPYDGALDFAGQSGATLSYPGYTHVSQTFFEPAERLRITGTGSMRIYFHPTSRQDLGFNTLPAGHWGQMRSSMEVGIDDSLILILTY